MPPPGAPGLHLLPLPAPGAPGVLWFVPQLHKALYSVLVSPRTLAIGFRAHPLIQDDLISRFLITSASALFPTQCTSTGSRVRMWAQLLQGHHATAGFVGPGESGGRGSVDSKHV